MDPQMELALRQAGLDTELIADVMESCHANGITVLALGKGVLDAQKVQEKLYLTAPEAARVLEICYALSQAPAADDKETRSAKNSEAGSWSSSAVEERSGDGAVVVGDVDVSAQGNELDSPLPLVKASEEAEADVAEIVLESLPASPAPVVTFKPSTPPKPSPAHLSPSFKASPPAIRTVIIHVEDAASNVPSYLRSTATTRTRKEQITSPTASQAASAKSPAKSPAKRSGLFSRMGSTLLAPTAAFLARVTGKKPVLDIPANNNFGGKATGSPLPISPKILEQGQRVTRPQPFQLTTDLRPKAQAPLSKEEMDLAEAKANAFKRNPVPKSLHESRPLEFRAASTPKDPNDIFQPFQLASLGLHAKKLSELKAKADEELRKDNEARVFKARDFNKKLTEGPQTPPKPEPTAVTQGTDFVSHADARLKHYHEVVEPVKKAKEAELNKEKLAEAAKVQALLDLSVDDFRRTLEFKAMDMPSFASPFKPDASRARAVTQSQEFNFNTDARLGKATAHTRDDAEGRGLGVGVYDGDGYSSAFTASLRSRRNGGFLRASMSAVPTTPERKRNGGGVFSGLGDDASPRGGDVGVARRTRAGPMSASAVMRKSATSFGAIRRDSMGTTPTKDVGHRTLGSPGGLSREACMAAAARLVTVAQ